MTTGEHDGALPTVPGCALDRPRLAEQLARYAQLGRQAATVDRSPGQVRVRFTDRPDTALLDRTLAVERRCCPFLQARFDEHGQELVFTAETLERDPWLDSIFDALSGPSRA